MKKTIFDWLESYKPENDIYFLTLTTRFPQNQYEFQKALQLWIRKLKYAYFGRKECPEIFHITVFERTFAEALHAHILIEDLSKVESTKTFKPTKEFPILACSIWNRLDISGQPIAQNIQRVYEFNGVLSYLLKDQWCSKKFDDIPLNLMSLPTKYLHHHSHVLTDNQ